MKTGFLCRAATAIALFSLNPAHARNLGADGGERYVQCDWQAARFELTLGRNQGKAVLYRIGAGSWTEYDFSTKRFVARTCEQIDESAVDRCEPEVNGTIYSFTGYSGNALSDPVGSSVRQFIRIDLASGAAHWQQDRHYWGSPGLANTSLSDEGSCREVSAPA